MYQLVKKKKKNIFLIILVFILGSAVLKEVLTVAFGPPPVSKQLDDLAASVNKRCPILIDSNTTLTNCLAINGHRLHFNYKFNSVIKEEVDTLTLAAISRQEMINRIKTNPDFRMFKQNDLSVSASFYDVTGVYICGAAIAPADYK